MSFDPHHLEVSIRPSPWHCLLLTLVHLLAIVALGMSGLPLSYMAALGFAVLVSYTYTLRRFGLLRDASSVIRLAWHSGEWQVVLGSGTVEPVHLDSTTLVLAWLVVANFRDSAGRRYPIVLMRDSANADEFRRLRVLLKYGQPKVGSE